jgi:stress responsive alpha/beta barrel protein
LSNEPSVPSPVIRRIVLWLWNEDASPERRIRAKEGLAYIRYGGHVDALDFGEHIGTGVGSGRAFDLALLRDHVDRASWDVYVNDPHHFRVGNYIDTITHKDLTARIDYLYAGPPSTRDVLRHIAMYRWRDGVGEPDKARLRAELDGVRAVCAELRALQFGPDLGLGTDHFDWVVESHFDDVNALRSYLAHPTQKRAASLLGSLTDQNRTARLLHRMLSG